MSKAGQEEPHLRFICPFKVEIYLLPDVKGEGKDCHLAML